MAEYVIFAREHTNNNAELDEYARTAFASVQGHKVVPRAFYGHWELLEGTAIEAAAILEFPTVAEARVWYESPLYQHAAMHRRPGSEYRIFIVEGV